MAQSLGRNRHLIMAKVDNRPGVLSRITGLFTRRGYNIESLVTGMTASPDVYHITVTVIGTDDDVALLARQLERCMEVIDVKCDGGDTCPGNRFTDMPSADNWAHAGIDYAVKHGLFAGMSETTFAPGVTMTRSMLVRVLWKLAGSPAHGEENPFTDVKSGDWFYDGVVWAAENEIVAGMGGGIFAPGEPVTREQIAAILYRYSEKAGKDVTQKADLSAFPDAADVSKWAADALAWANANGYISGTKEGESVYLRPQ